MAEVEIFRYNMPTVRWFCNTCGIAGPRYDNDHGQGDSTARAGAAVHRGQCAGPREGGESDE